MRESSQYARATGKPKPLGPYGAGAGELHEDTKTELCEIIKKIRSIDGPVATAGHETWVTSLPAMSGCTDNLLRPAIRHGPFQSY